MSVTKKKAVRNLKMGELEVQSMMAESGLTSHLKGCRHSLMESIMEGCNR